MSDFDNNFSVEDIFRGRDANYYKIWSLDCYKRWLGDNFKTSFEHAICRVLDIPNFHYRTGISQEKGLWLFHKIENTSIHTPRLVQSKHCLAPGREVTPRTFTLDAYQYISDFPYILYEAYEAVVGTRLFLKDTSPVRIFYDLYAQFDTWKLKDACALISHRDPQKPNDSDYMPFANLDRYNYNLDLAYSSIKAGNLKYVNGHNGFVTPLEFIKWAEQKGINFHPILKLLVILHSNKSNLNPTHTAPSMVSLMQYTTPYLELMNRAIEHLKLSNDNQLKVEEDLIPWFIEELKIIEGKTDGLHNKAKAMASFVRLPSSAKGGLKKHQKSK